MMPDCYSENLGDGWVRHHDYGMVTVTRHGEEYVECECGKLFPESEADDRDGLCRDCYEEKRACSYCGEIFEDGLKKVDGHLYCPTCYTEELERTVALATQSMKAIAEEMGKAHQEAKEFVEQQFSPEASPHYTIGALKAILKLTAEELTGKAEYFERVLPERERMAV